MRFFFLTLLIACIGFTDVLAQVVQPAPKFSTDPTTFISQVNVLLDAPKRDDCTQTAKEFADAWNFYSSDQKQLIISMANMMSDRKMLTIPFFLDFFQALRS